MGEGVGEKGMGEENGEGGKGRGGMGSGVGGSGMGGGGGGGYRCVYEVGNLIFSILFPTTAFPSRGASPRWPLYSQSHTSLSFLFDS